MIPKIKEWGFLLLKETFSGTGYLDNQGLTVIGSFEYVSKYLGLLYLHPSFQWNILHFESRNHF